MDYAQSGQVMADLGYLELFDSNSTGESFLGFDISKVLDQISLDLQKLDDILPRTLNSDRGKMASYVNNLPIELAPIRVFECYNTILCSKELQ